MSALTGALALAACSQGGGKAENDALKVRFSDVTDVPLTVTDSTGAVVEPVVSSYGPPAGSYTVVPWTKAAAPGLPGHYTDLEGPLTDAVTFWQKASVAVYEDYRADVMAQREASGLSDIWLGHHYPITAFSSIMGLFVLMTVGRAAFAFDCTFQPSARRAARAALVGRSRRPA